MNSVLTDRQIKLLEAIIKEYSESSVPVGSKTVVKKYSLKVSPATVRNEMASLLDDGFLEMMHTSSGRVPTPRAFRFFIEELMEEDEIPVLQEVAFKQKLWSQRFEFEKMLREAVLSLSDVVGNLAVAVTSEGFVTHAGAYHILDSTEFLEVEVAKSMLKLLDRYELLKTMFDGVSKNSDVTVAVGDEIGQPNMDYCAIALSPFRAGNKSGYISVFGPSRMNYPTVVPVVRYTRNLVEELANSQ
jgi:transcriptional regulator of heat shock response